MDVPDDGRSSDQITPAAPSVTLPRRQFGRSQRLVSEIGFGCGGFWGLPVFSERKAEALLRYGLDRGITFLDTGPNYSGGKAEARLGKLTGGRYTGVMLATKVGSRLLPNGRVVRDFTPEGMEASLRDSLRRLKSDHVDLLQLHGPALATIADDRVLGALDGFVARGMITYKGVSADGDVALHVAKSRFFDALMTTYNVLVRESLPALKTASGNGMAVLVKSPLSHHVFGRDLFKLTSLSRVWYLLRVLKNYRHLMARGRRLKLGQCMPGWTAAEIALKFVLRESAVSSAVVGTTRLDHLRQNLGVAAKGELSLELLAAIDGPG